MEDSAAAAIGIFGAAAELNDRPLLRGRESRTEVVKERYYDSRNSYALSEVAGALSEVAGALSEPASKIVLCN